MDKVYIKTKNDGKWQNSPNSIFALYLIVGIILMFTFIFIGIFTEGIISIIFYILSIASISIISIVMPINNNNKYNISASIGFVKRNNKLYVIKLMYEGQNKYVYVNDSLNIVALPNNITTMNEIQNKEKNIRQVRQIKETYTNALNDILSSIDNKEYSINKFDSLDQFDVVVTKTAKYGFIELKDAQLINENNEYIIISYFDTKNNKKNIKFRNCYGDLTKELK